MFNPENITFNRQTIQTHFDRITSINEHVENAKNNIVKTDLEEILDMQDEVNFLAKGIEEFIVKHIKSQ